ncbi:LysM peptidoglycan-binding domain-containing protein [Pararhizobium mangrovi]|nr:LysM domain-containing protein [Pararhizobium mangrovi]
MGSSASQAACGRVQTGRGSSALAIAQGCGTDLQQLRIENPSVDFNKPLNGQIIRVPRGRKPGAIPPDIARGAPPSSTVVPQIHRSTPVIRPRQSSDAFGRRGNVYTVRRGDTLSAIADAAGVSLAGLRAANPRIEPRRLIVGQRIALPATD